MIASTTVHAHDGFPLAVQTSGNSNGPALLLLSGQANSHDWWTGLREDFDADFRVVSVDYRGTGGSRGEVGEWSTASFAADAAHVLAALGIERASVYGTSMGGRVAQLLALDHPAVVDRLVLACTSPGGSHALERSTGIRRSLMDPDAARRRAVLHELFYTDDRPYEPERSHLLGDPTLTPAETRAHLRVSARHDAWDRLDRIAAPTLVLHGADDLMVPTANAPLLAARIPGAILHIHPLGRHGFFDEFAADVVPTITAFLRS